MPVPGSDEAPLIPSASVIIVRAAASRPEILLVQRNQNIKFHGGAWVFPGGKVDAADYGDSGSIDDGAVQAALRESEEEVGLVLDSTQLVSFAHWTTPVSQPKRYSTWFFITAVAADIQVTIDESEIVAYRWETADDALALQASGELTLPPPTFVSLTKLKALSDAGAIQSFVDEQGYQLFAPRIVEVEDGRIALYDGDAGYELHDATVAGARHRLNMIDGGWHYERT